MATQTNTIEPSSMPPEYNPLELARIGYGVVGNQGMEAFCKRTKLSRSMVSRLLNGSLKSPPRVSTIYKFVEGNQEQAEKMLVACGYPFDALKKINDKVHTNISPRSQVFATPSHVKFLHLMIRYLIAIWILLYFPSNPANTTFEDMFLYLKRSLWLPHSDDGKNIDTESFERKLSTMRHGWIILHPRADLKDEIYIGYLDPGKADPENREIAEKLEESIKDRTSDNTRLFNLDNVSGLTNYLSNAIPTAEMAAFTITEETETTTIHNVIIPAFCSESDPNTDTVVISAAKNLKHFLSHYTQHSNNSENGIEEELIKFYIVTNSCEVKDIFSSSFPNYGLNIEMLLVDGTDIVERQVIPSIK